MCHSMASTNYFSRVSNTRVDKDKVSSVIHRSSLLLSAIAKWILPKTSNTSSSFLLEEMFWHAMESVINYLYRDVISLVSFDDSVVNLFLIALSCLERFDSNSQSYQKSKPIQGSFSVISCCRRIFRDKLYSVMLRVLFQPHCFQLVATPQQAIKNLLVILMNSISLDVKRYTGDYSGIFTVARPFITLSDIHNLSSLSNAVGLTNASNKIHFNGKIKRHNFYQDIIYHIGILTAFNIRPNNKNDRELIIDMQYSGILSAMDMLLNLAYETIDAAAAVAAAESSNLLKDRNSRLLNHDIAKAQRLLLSRYSNFYQNKSNFRYKMHCFKLAVKSVWSFDQIYSLLFSDRFNCFSKYDGKQKLWKHLEALIFIDPASVILYFNDMRSSVYTKRMFGIRNLPSTIGCKHVIDLLNKLCRNLSGNVISNNNVLFITRLFLFAKEAPLLAASEFLNRVSLNSQTGQLISQNIHFSNSTIVSYFLRCTVMVVISNYMNSLHQNNDIYGGYMGYNITRLSYYTPLFIQLLRRDFFHVISDVILEMINSLLLLPKEIFRFILSLEYESNLPKLRQATDNEVNKLGYLTSKSSSSEGNGKESVQSSKASLDNREIIQKLRQKNSILSDKLPNLSEKLLFKMYSNLSKDANKVRYIDSINFMLKDLLDIAEEANYSSKFGKSGLFDLRSRLESVHVPLNCSIETLSKATMSLPSSPPSSPHDIYVSQPSLLPHTRYLGDSDSPVSASILGSPTLSKTLLKYRARDSANMISSITPVRKIKMKIIDIDRSKAQLYNFSAINGVISSMFFTAVCIPFIVENSWVSSPTKSTEESKSRINGSIGFPDISMEKSTVVALKSNLKTAKTTKRCSSRKLRFNLNSSSSVSDLPSAFTSVNQESRNSNTNDTISDTISASPTYSSRTAPSSAPSLASVASAPSLHDASNSRFSTPDFQRRTGMKDNILDDNFGKPKVMFHVKPYYDGRTEQWSMHISQILQNRFSIVQLPLSFSIYTLIPCTSRSKRHGCIAEAIQGSASAELVYSAGFRSLSDYYRYKFGKQSLGYEIRKHDDLTNSTNSTTNYDVALTNLAKSFSAIAVLCFIIDVEILCSSDFLINHDGSVALTGSSLCPHSMYLNYITLTQKLRSLLSPSKSKFMIDLGRLLQESYVNTSIWTSSLINSSYYRSSSLLLHNSMLRGNSKDRPSMVSVYSLITSLSISGRLACIDIAQELINFGLLMVDSGIFQEDSMYSDITDTSSSSSSSSSSSTSVVKSTLSMSDADSNPNPKGTTSKDVGGSMFSIKVDYLDNFQRRVQSADEVSQVVSTFSDWLSKWI